MKWIIWLMLGITACAQKDETPPSQALIINGDGQIQAQHHHPRITKFGVITEDFEGKLIFEDFDVDCDGARMTPSECVVAALADSLEKHLRNGTLEGAVNGGDRKTQQLPSPRPSPEFRS